MAVGFVLVKAAPRQEREVFEALMKVGDIVELHPLFGEFDFLAKVETSSYDELGRVVIGKIRAIDGVKETQTLTGTRL